ncbi:MAG: methyltransferase domain-containing protein [Proteobacteria bacterium]|nr:methyltransferase domain-containing protein [Pseudomonadota bacterium]
MASYLLAGQESELERLQLQARVWEPAGRALLEGIPAAPGARALDVGCGARGWLGILDAWVGAGGTVVGSDTDERMLAAASAWTRAAGLSRVTLVADDLFDSRLGRGSFDLVHARFQIAPLGRADEQVAAYRGLLKPGGWLVLEDPDPGSWRLTPTAPAATALIELIQAGFQAAGGDFAAGRALPGLMRAAGLEPSVTAAVVALEPRHPYLRLPLQFAAALRPRLEALTGRERLDRLIADAEAELARPDTWGTTFTLIQAAARSTG